VSSEGQGIGFAVPINLARAVLDQLRTSGHVSRGYLGIQLHELDPDLQKLLGLKEPRGALVLEVVPGSAGQTAGLRRYDVVTGVSGQPVEDGDQLVRTIAGLKPGSPVTLSVFRDGKTLSLEAKLTERAPEDAAPPPRPAADSVSVKGDALGLVVGDLGPKAKKDLPVDKVGAVVKDVLGVDPGTDALDQGDIIVEVNRKATPNAAAYKHVVATLSSGETAWLYVYRPRPPGSFLTKIEVEDVR
jgi:serine protease Do